VVNIQNVPALPDPAGLAPVYAAMANGNMFRDMSGLAQIAALAATTTGSAQAGAGQMMTAAGAAQQVAANLFTDVLEMAIQAALAANGKLPISGLGGSGAMINEGASLDQKRSGAGTSGGGTPSPNGTSSTGSETVDVPGTGGSGSSELDAFNAALGGGSGMQGFLDAVATSILGATLPDGGTGKTATDAGVIEAGDDKSAPSLASNILKRSDRITLATVHVSTQQDNATAQQNIQDTADGRDAALSSYGTAPGGTVALDTRLLEGLLSLADDYTFSVSELAGGSHSRNSRHYVGVAADITDVNGQAVSASHPDVTAFMQRCRTLGATEVLGPGDPNHDAHVHCAWPRPTK
jgi:hypothetical protein